MSARRETVHEKIAQTLRDRISYGIYPEHQMLPPEMLLLAEFKVSRHTVREAMKALVSEGLIERSPGRGTVVSPRQGIGGSWGIKSISDLMAEFDASQIVVLKRGIVSAKSFPDIAALFSLRPSDSLFRIHRVVSQKDGPAVLQTLFTLMTYASRLPKEGIGYQPLIGMIEQHCRIRAFYTRQLATATGADALAAKLLGVRIGEPLLALRRIYFNHKAEPIECTELQCRPDRYQQTVEFLRERSSRSSKTRPQLTANDKRKRSPPRAR